MRQEYEFIIKKKHQDLDTWYKQQVKERCPNFPKFPLTSGPNANASLLFVVSQSAAVAQEAASPTGVQSSQSDLHELKRTFQALEIDLQAQCSKVSLSWKHLRSGTTSSTKPSSLSGAFLSNSLGALLHPNSHFPSKLSTMRMIRATIYWGVRAVPHSLHSMSSILTLTFPDRSGVPILEIRAPKPQTVKWVDPGHTVNKWPVVKPHGGVGLGWGWGGQFYTFKTPISALPLTTMLPPPSSKKEKFWCRHE